MNDWGHKFNQLPLDIRTIAIGCETTSRIKALQMEKARLKRLYQIGCTEINAEIANHEKHLRRLELDKD